MTDNINAPCAVLLRCGLDPVWRIGYLRMNEKLEYFFHLQQPCTCGYTSIHRDAPGVDTWVRLDNYT